MHHYIGRLEISVVGSNPDMLTMNVRDVIIGFKDQLLQKTFYIRADSSHDKISATSVSLKCIHFLCYVYNTLLYWC